MRDINRIPTILKELAKIWKSNPDYRLGQLVCVFTKPFEPCHEIFNIEDEKLLEGLHSFKTKNAMVSNEINSPIWKKYPDVSKVETQSLSKKLIKSYIIILSEENNEITITPKNLMKLNCAPVNDKSWMNNQKQRIEIIAGFLEELKNEGLISEIEKGYNINPMHNNR